MEKFKTLEEARKGANLTKYQLADDSGVSRRTLVYIENGDTDNPSIDVRRRLEIVFGAHVDWLRTCGFYPVKAKQIWEEAEFSLRQAISNVQGLLPGDEQGDFIKLARQYLDYAEKHLSKPVKDPVRQSEALTALTKSRKKSTKI